MNKRKIMDFIIKNGWKEALESGGYKSFHKEGNISFDIDDDSITFIGDEGDFLTFNISDAMSFYSFLGYMIHHGYLAMGYKAV